MRNIDTFAPLCCVTEKQFHSFAKHRAVLSAHIYTHRTIVCLDGKFARTACNLIIQQLQLVKTSRRTEKCSLFVLCFLPAHNI